MKRTLVFPLKPALQCFAGMYWDLVPECFILKVESYKGKILDCVDEMAPGCMYIGTCPGFHQCLSPA